MADGHGEEGYKISEAVINTAEKEIFKKEYVRSQTGRAFIRAKGIPGALADLTLKTAKRLKESNTLDEELEINQKKLKKDSTPDPEERDKNATDLLAKHPLSLLTKTVKSGSPVYNDEIVRDSLRKQENEEFKKREEANNKKWEKHDYRRKIRDNLRKEERGYDLPKTKNPTGERFFYKELPNTRLLHFSPKARLCLAGMRGGLLIALSLAVQKSSFGIGIAAGLFVASVVGVRAAYKEERYDAEMEGDFKFSRFGKNIWANTKEIIKGAPTKKSDSDKKSAAKVACTALGGWLAFSLPAILGLIAKAQLFDRERRDAEKYHGREESLPHFMEKFYQTAENIGRSAAVTIGLLGKPNHQAPESVQTPPPENEPDYSQEGGASNKSDRDKSDRNATQQSAAKDGAISGCASFLSESKLKTLKEKFKDKTSPPKFLKNLFSKENKENKLNDTPVNR